MGIEPQPFRVSDPDQSLYQLGYCSSKVVLYEMEFKNLNEIFTVITH
jgi:hypothetical protein